MQRSIGVKKGVQKRIKSYGSGGHTGGHKKKVVRALHSGELVLSPKQTNALAKALKISVSERPSAKGKSQ